MRRRYRYDEATQALVEVEVVRGPAPKVFFHTDTPYAGLRATGAEFGKDISTRKRHRDYMKEHNYALHEDFKEFFAKQTEERERERMGVAEDPTLRDDIVEAYNMVEQGYKPAPRPEADDDGVVSSYIVGKDV